MRSLVPLMCALLVGLSGGPGCRSEPRASADEARPSPPPSPPSCVDAARLASARAFASLDLGDLPEALRREVVGGLGLEGRLEGARTLLVGLDGLEGLPALEALDARGGLATWNATLAEQAPHPEVARLLDTLSPEPDLVLGAASFEGSPPGTGAGLVALWLGPLAEVKLEARLVAPARQAEMAGLQLRALSQIARELEGEVLERAASASGVGPDAYRRYLAWLRRAFDSVEVTHVGGVLRVGASTKDAPLETLGVLLGRWLANKGR